MRYGGVLVFVTTSLVLRGMLTRGLTSPSPLNGTLGNGHYARVWLTQVLCLPPWA